MSSPSDQLPPVVSLQQSLPFEKLLWKNFERLCLTIVRENRDEIFGCYLYGTEGQKQHGIDLYADQKADGKVAVFQCRRISSLTASGIKKAVDAFMKGRWASETSKFVICTLLTPGEN